MKAVSTPLYLGLQSLPCSRFTCRRYFNARSRCLYTQNRTLHSSASKRSSRQNDKISSIARQIQETGELPPLPTASIFELPTLPRQRKLRDQNIIRDDIKATVDAHYAANVLAHGNIHIKLGDFSYPEPRRLQVTPPNYISKPSDSNGQSTKYGQDQTILHDPAEWMKNRRHNNIAESIGKQQEVVASSELQARLSEIDPSLDALRRLDAEIRVFQEWIEPTQDEHDAASGTWSRFQQAVASRFPEYRFQLQGSRVYGLARPFSDIDVQLVIRKFERTDKGRGRGLSRTAVKQKYMSALHRVKQWLEDTAREEFAPSLVRNARVPLLEIQDRKQRYLKLDLAAGMGRPIKYHIEYVKYFQAEHPQIQSLFLLLRWWLEASNIGDSSLGGVTSYLTFCMILTSITHSGASYHGDELGKQLLHFLRFWTRTDWETLGFAPDPARTFPKFAVNIMEETVLVENMMRESGSAFEQAPATSSAEMQDNIRISQPHSVQNDDAGNLAAAHQKSNPATEIAHNSDAYLEGIKFLTHQANALHRTPRSRRRYFLLQDPADPRRNIGASLGRFPELQLMMKKALCGLEQRIRKWDEQTPAAGTSGAQQFLLQDLVYVRLEDDDSMTYQPDKIVQDFERKRHRLVVDMAKDARLQRTKQS